MSFVKRAPKYDWRGSLTTDEAARASELERECEVIDKRRRQLTRELNTIRNRGINRLRYWIRHGKVEA